jgi:putative ABC transport system ATP-binding protein
MTAIVRLENVSKDYPLGKLKVPALRGVTLEILPGEFTAVAGPSGSGKTTLLNLVGCVDSPTAGKVFVEEEDVTALPERRLTRLRLERLGFIFQSFNLIGVLDAFQNVEFPLLLQGRLTRSARRERVLSLIEKVGLKDHVRHRPNELSGGQRQRVAIARALVTQPGIVLADEPTANLDTGTGAQIVDLMKAINETEGTTFIFSTHDTRVMGYAHRVVRLEDGRVVEASGR